MRLQHRVKIAGFGDVIFLPFQVLFCHHYVNMFHTFTRYNITFFDTFFFCTVRWTEERNFITRIKGRHTIISIGDEIESDFLIKILNKKSD